MQRLISLIPFRIIYLESRFHTEIEKFRSQPNFHRTIYHRMVGKLFRFFFFLSLLRSLFTTSTTITTTTTTQRSLQQPSVLPSLSLSPSPSPASFVRDESGQAEWWGALAIRVNSTPGCAAQVRLDTRL